MTTALSAAQPKVQLNKRIYGWEELDAAVSGSVRLAENKVTPVSGAVLLAAARFYPGHRCAQLEERVIAIACHDRIILAYGHIPPGCGLEALEMQWAVAVRPAAGGRTSYEIDMKVNGWFANKHLPMTAKDRGGRSVYRNTRWYCGSGSMYSTGQGPLYPDVGPDCQNISHDRMLDDIRSAPQPDDSWKEKACGFLDRLREGVSPFGDARLRYWSSGLAHDDDPAECHFTDNASSFTTNLHRHCAWGVRVRIKHPARWRKDGYENTPDMCVSILGRAHAFESPEEISYSLNLCHAGPQVVPVHLHLHARASRGDLSAFDVNRKWCVTTNGKSVIEAARHWCAGNIYIPAN
jgi:hypothetical protein